MPLFFSGGLFHTQDFSLTCWLFVAFSLAASSIYCFNDIIDIDNDRTHHKKKQRPIASGAVSVPQAYTLMLTLLCLSVFVLFVSGLSRNIAVAALLGSYYLINIAYSLRLKHYPIVDVFIIATGFLIRVIIGGYATGTLLSHWIIQMTFLLALFLAFCKRRDDVVIFSSTGIKPRQNTDRYTLEFINPAIAIIAAVTLVCYIMYSTSAEVTQRFQSQYVYVTSLFVLAGFLRYLHVTIVYGQSGNPVQTLVKDRFLQASLLGWIAAFFTIIYL